jgi:hypothetical protein
VSDVSLGHGAYFFKVKKSTRRGEFFLDCWTLKMKALRFVETFGTVYQCARRNVAETFCNLSAGGIQIDVKEEGSSSLQSLQDVNCCAE